MHNYETDLTQCSLPLRPPVKRTSHHTRADFRLYAAVALEGPGQNMNTQSVQEQKMYGKVACSNVTYSSNGKRR